ncbi:thioredoxin domain-containing protein [Pannus brasiliensis CCIBt3594]|uniref:Thioredoxin domain-containing protein n=1 Tax=Pannus brasiliensis CCIBt3594 TaxID=1427578 RepID=A0AAW9QUZ3_9CHRO
MPNHLVKSRSLYLQKHVHNPIDWWYWCEEALDIAKKEDKPIFLSIGYSSCHWCTVMEGEAFSNPAIANYLNTHFLPIKVDREERPDIDSIYMQALQMMTGQGGWPLNIFLTPDRLIPFYGGTYFPVDPRFGRPGFLQVLQSVRRYYDEEKEKLAAFTREMLGALQQSAILPIADTNLQSDELLYRGIESSTAVIGVSMNRYGRPSFPMIPYANLALEGQRFLDRINPDLAGAAYQRGEDLALGGIYDHVAGGFHRYTVDSTWTVPHFEKMLYDNGQIVEYLANLWSAGDREPAFRRAIAGTVNWLKREMTAPAGYFYAAQDADSFRHATDSEPEEGAFYVWSYDELADFLDRSELQALQNAFTLTPEGNFEGQNVLQRHDRGELSDEIEAILAKLFFLRYGAYPHEIETFPPAINNEQAKTGEWRGRIPAVTDPKMIVAWNSLMISGLARASVVFGEEEYREMAIRAARFILENQRIENRLYRLNYGGQPSVFAQAEDYAYLIKALLDLHEGRPTETEWLAAAIEIQSEFDRHFGSIEFGGYFNTADDNTGDLIIRERGYNDNATPSANGIAITNLIRLSHLTENLDYLASAERALGSFSAVLTESPTSCPILFVALDNYRHGFSVRVREGDLPGLIDRYLPTAVYRVDTELSEYTFGLICQGLTCLEPARDREQLLDRIEGVIKG